MTNGKRDYKKEAKYDSKPSVMAKRNERTKARDALIREGKVHVGDGKDVDHIKPLSKGGSLAKSNLRVVPASENRSFARNANGTLKSQTSKKEAAKRGKK